MPILKIIQPIYYKSSKFEKTIERKLLNYGIILPEPEMCNAEELKEEGIFRIIEGKIEGKKIELRYQKYSGRNDFIKTLTKRAFSQIKSINEQKLLQILNTNKIYCESLSLICSYENITTEISLEEKKPCSIKYNKFMINFEESPKLFWEMLVTYVKTFNVRNINLRQIFENLEQINDENLIPYSLEEANKITGITLSKDDYISMLVNYFIYRTRKTNQ